MGDKLGFEGYLYRNSGTYELPVWVLIDNVRDLTLDVSSSEVDATTRANGGWKATRQGLNDGSIEFQMIDDRTDTNLTAIQTARETRGSVEILCLDGPQATAGSYGLRATMAVTQFKRNEPLDGMMAIDVTLKPTRAANAPEMVTMPLA